MKFAEGYVYTRVCLSMVGVHGGGHAWQGGMCGRGVCMAVGVCVAGGVHGRGHVWQGDMCGMHAPPAQ